MVYQLQGDGRVQQGGYLGVKAGEWTDTISRGDQVINNADIYPPDNKYNMWGAGEAGRTSEMPVPRVRRGPRVRLAHALTSATVRPPVHVLAVWRGKQLKNVGVSLRDKKDVCLAMDYPSVALLRSTLKMWDCGTDQAMDVDLGESGELCTGPDSGRKTQAGDKTFCMDGFSDQNGIGAYMKEWSQVGAKRWYRTFQAALKPIESFYRSEQSAMDVRCAAAAHGEA